MQKYIYEAKTFDEFLVLMKKDKYEIKQGKYIAFKFIGQERFIRAYKLGTSYSEEMIKKRIDNVIKDIQK